MNSTYWKERIIENMEGSTPEQTDTIASFATLLAQRDTILAELREALTNENDTHPFINLVRKYDKNAWEYLDKLGLKERPGKLILLMGGLFIDPID